MTHASLKRNKNQTNYFLDKGLRVSTPLSKCTITLPMRNPNQNNTNPNCALTCKWDTCILGRTFHSCRFCLPESEVKVGMVVMLDNQGGSSDV